MTTESETYFRAMLDALPEGWRIVDGPYENLAGKSVAYVAPVDRPSLRVRVSVEGA
jgi:hypothetical protein